MKERYIPVEPLTKGIQVSSLAAKKITEAIKPRVEPRMRRSALEFMAVLFGENS